MYLTTDCFHLLLIWIMDFLDGFARQLIYSLWHWSTSSSYLTFCPAWSIPHSPVISTEKWSWFATCKRISRSSLHSFTSGWYWPLQLNDSLPSTFPWNTCHNVHRIFLVGSSWSSLCRPFSPIFIRRSSSPKSTTEDSAERNSTMSATWAIWTSSIRSWPCFCHLSLSPF